MRYGGDASGAYGGFAGGGSAFDPADVDITGGSITGVSGVPYKLASWGVPCILASSGTMGDNGAVSGMTILPTTYSGGAWLYLPANAISASSAAGFYWFVASSTTAGTVYNSTWDGTGVPTAGTTTAFSTTGPGAFTGISSGEITVATITVPAGAMGPNGKFRAELALFHNTAAGNKIFRVNFGATAVSATASTNQTSYGLVEVSNLGVAGSQRGVFALPAAGSGTLLTTVYPAANTANAVTVTFTLEKATATNHAILDGATVLLVKGS